MRRYFDEYVKFTDTTLLERVQLSIYERVRTVLHDLTTALDFSLDKENHKIFDDLLQSTRIEELKLLVRERQYLIESDELKEKLLKLKDKINTVFKEIDGVGLSMDYNS